MKNLINAYRYCFILALMWTPFIFPAPAFADEDLTPESEVVHVMPKVTVTGKQTDSLSTTKIIDQELIKMLPGGSKFMTDLLTTVPGVLFPENHNNSKTGGEISPAEISISGGRANENNFMLDGVGINNFISPGSSIDTVSDIPSHSQEYFIPEHLIKDITVYRSNIPVRYGSFTGGVVIANTKDPEPEFTGELNYKTTRSDWGHFFIDSAEQNEFEHSTNSENQPHFTKHKAAATVHFPITINSSSFFSYSRTESSIPLTLLSSKKVEYRRSENLFLKYQLKTNKSTKITLSSSYSPYRSDNFLENTLNSDYQYDAGGIIFNSKLNKKTPLADIEFTLGLEQSENSRNAPQNWKNWWVSDSKNWGNLADDKFSSEGGFGDIEKIQQSLNAKVNVDFKEVSQENLKHRITAGLEFEHNKATFDRLETTTRYSYASRNEAVDCNGDTTDCSDGDQFFFYSTVYPADSAKAELNNYHAYLDDTMNFSLLTVRPGIRVSYDDYQKNMNFAPRLAATIDVFNNQKTFLIAGFNRYYGAELLAHKLASQKEPYQVWRRSTTLDDFNHPQTWYQASRSTINATQVSDLKTPHSDEITFGLKQQLLGGELELLYIDRDYKDQLMTLILDKDPNGYIYQEFTNAGRRRHEEFTISWEKSWKKHYLNISFVWQETKSSSLSYSDIFDPDIEEVLVWYDGKPVSINKLQTSDFNRPYIASLVYAIDLPKGFSFTNETRYTSRYRAVESTGDTHTYNGVDLNVYDDVSNPSALIFNWKIVWESPAWENNSFELSIDINNVFNRKVVIGNEINSYKLGRQYWAGLTYKF